MTTNQDKDRIARATRAEVERIDRRVKIGLLVVSGMSIVALGWAAFSENLLASWKRFRVAYAEILHERAADDFGKRLASNFSEDMQQIVLPDGRIDRCISCHTGVDDPRMADAPQPFTTHPGRYLALHEPARFGCTVCHEGQGRATEKDDAHGHAPFWDYPLLEKQLTKTTCTKCHSRTDLFGVARWIDAADDPASGSGDGSRLLDRGWRLVRDKGCLGCHVLDGKGGVLGPDLTIEGDKTPHEFSFAHVSQPEPRRVTTWHREHFLDPAQVSPASQMPNMNLTEADAEALTAVMLSLRSKGPQEVWRVQRPDGEVRSGAELYATYCSACHGAEGRGNAIAWIYTPSLHNDDVLGVVDDDYLRRIIHSGRRGTYMPGWGEGHGNLSDEEIDRIVGHIRSWQDEAGEPLLARAEMGDVEIGREYYQGLCANCHGKRGEGGIGISLNSPTFQAVASDRFLAETIARGRPGTAMSGWQILPTQGIADLVAYLRTWRAEAPSYEAVRAAQRRTPRAEALRVGRIVYHENCAACHGVEGEGGIGVSLRTPGLLRVADDRFLYRTIVDGRPGTAMPAWRHLRAEDIAAVLTYVRSWQKGPRVRLTTGRRRGDYIAGESYYRISCARCHGDQGQGTVGPQITNRVLLDTASDAMLFEWIAHGRPGTAMKGFLPEEQGPTKLTARQIEDVIAYLRYAQQGGRLPLRRLGAGDPHVGAQLYRGTCASCHGPNGEGASGPQLNNPAFLQVASDGYLAATIVLGRVGTPMRSMVHGRQGIGQIEPAKVADIVAFIRQWENAPAPRTPAQYVDLTEHAIANGKRYFRSYCSGCHGPNGRGALDGSEHYAPALHNQDFLAAVSDGFLMATIARGRRGTPMRPFGQGAGGIVSLPPDQIRDLVSFIRSWEIQPARTPRQVAAAGGSEP